MFLFRFIIRLMAFLLAVFIILPIVVLLILASQKLRNRTLNKRIVNSWSKLLCFVCGVKITVNGHKQESPVLVVANHVSWLDIPVIHSQKLLGFVAKKEIASWPLFGALIKSGETVFIARGKHESRKKVLDMMQQRLEQGRSIGIFPEGKATNGEKLGRFHRQLMQAALEAQVPIQAVAIKFLYKDGSKNKQIAFQNNENFIVNVLRILCLKSSIAELNFCDPIDPANKSARQVALIAQQQVAEKLAKNDYI